MTPARILGHYEMPPVCGKRYANLICTLPVGHEGSHWHRASYVAPESLTFTPGTTVRPCPNCRGTGRLDTP